MNRWGGLQSPPDQDKQQDAHPQTLPRKASPASAPPPDWLPSDQGRNDVGDGAVEVRQHFFNRPGNGQLLAQVFGTTHLLAVLADDLGQLLAPGERRGSQEATESGVRSRRHLLGMLRWLPKHPHHILALDKVCMLHGGGGKGCEATADLWSAENKEVWIRTTASGCHCNLDPGGCAPPKWWGFISYLTEIITAAVLSGLKVGSTNLKQPTNQPAKTFSFVNCSIR